MKILKREFKAWLEANKDKLVGEQGEPERCPIASYIKNTQGFEWVAVDGETVDYSRRATDEGHTSRLPKWCEKFVEQFDTLPLDEYDVWAYGEDALKALK